MGNKAVRSLLVHAAGLYLVWEKRDTALRDWALRIERRRGRAPSRVALARKLAVVMLAIWKSGRHFEPKNCLPAVEQVEATEPRSPSADSAEAARPA